MTNKPDRPKPRVIDLKPKPKPRMASALDRGSEPRAGGKVDAPMEVFMSWGMKGLNWLRGNLALAVFLLACAGALVFILCISYCHAGGPKL